MGKNNSSNTISPDDLFLNEAGQSLAGYLTEPGLMARRAITTLIVVVAFLICGACLAQIDECASATGQLLPRAKIQQVDSSIDGTLKRVLVSNGAQVKKGDALVLLDTVEADADVTKWRQAQLSLQTQRDERLQAIAALKEIISNPHDIRQAPIAFPQADKIAGKLYSARQALNIALFDALDQTKGNRGKTSDIQQLRNKQQLLRDENHLREKTLSRALLAQSAQQEDLQSKIQSLENQVIECGREVTELESTLEDAKSDLAIFERGRELGVSSGVKFLQVQDYVHQREYFLLQAKARLAALNQALSSARMDLEKSTSTYEAQRAEIMAEIESNNAQSVGVPISMNQNVSNLRNKRLASAVAVHEAETCMAVLQKEIDILNQKLASGEARLDLSKHQAAERTVISPVDGTVSQCTPLAPGQSISRGQELLRVTPADDDLVFRGYVNSADIGFVRPGQPVQLCLAAFPYEDFGITEGTVERVGAYPEEISNHDTKTDPPQDPTFAYRVTIVPSKLWIQTHNTRLPFKVGLNAVGNIVVRKRSWMALLLEPLLRREG